MKLTIFPDEKLRKRSVEVSFPLSKTNEKIIERLIAYIDESQKEGTVLRPGIGLAAVQLGYLKRIFYINVEYETDKFFKEVIINPVILEESDEYAALASGEGCLSIAEDAPGQEGLVHRKAKIVAKGYSYFDKQEKTWEMEGLLAIVFQHEYDHIEGKLFIDRINKEDRTTPYEGEIII